MIELPKSKLLPVHKLAAVFNDTTNSYKFYWFNAILNALKNEQSGIFHTSTLVIEMLNQVWYPLSYYRLSFGKSDGFKKIADYVNSCAIIDNSPNAPDLFTQVANILEASQIMQLNKEILRLNRWVPYRFIRPFFHEETTRLPDWKVNPVVEKLAAISAINYPTKCPYYFVGGKVHLNEIWRDYFIENLGILQGFVYWHLTNFVQKNNPNTFGISKKLFKPVERNLGKYKAAWEAFYNTKGSINCVYSCREVPRKFSLDHFIPWSFVVHDLNWNLLPVKKEVNSSKNDTLPHVQYLSSFAELQFEFFHLVSDIPNHYKVLEDYSLLFNRSIAEIKMLPQNSFEEELRKVIVPMIQIAANMGFNKDWAYAGE